MVHVSRDQDVALLARVPLFENVDVAHLRLLAYAAEHVRFSPDEYIVREGGEDPAGYLILEGEAEAFSGKEPEMRLRIARSTFIGESAMIAAHAHGLNVLAVTEVETLRISRDLFLRVCHEFPEMGRMVMANYAQRMANMASALHALLH